MAIEFELDNGLRPHRIARTLQRVYAICTMGDLASDEVLGDLETTIGWESVTGVLLATYGASDDAAANFTAQDFGEILYRAYGRGMETEQGPFSELPARERLAWEVVARHSGWVVQADEEDLGDLNLVERRWGDKYRHYARERGVNLEHRETIGQN